VLVSGSGYNPVMSRQFSLRTAFWLTAALAVCCFVWRATGEAKVAAAYGAFWLTFCISAIREHRRRSASPVQHADDLRS